MDELKHNYKVDREATNETYIWFTCNNFLCVSSIGFERWFWEELISGAPLLIVPDWTGRCPIMDPFDLSELKRLSPFSLGF